MARLMPPDLDRVRAVSRMAVDDWLADWRYARARVVFTVLGMWILWTLVCTLFIFSELAITRAWAEIGRSESVIAQWTDARSWDGMGTQVGTSERLGAGDSCAPTTPMQWRSDGGWHPACVVRIPDARTRVARAATPESLLVTLTRGELQAMAARRESSGEASLVSASKVPRIHQMITNVRRELKPLRFAGWGILGVSMWILFAAVAANERRRDATVALREILGQRSIETWWARCVSMTLWTLVCSGLPLAGALALGLSNTSQLAAVAATGYAIALADFALADARVRRRRSLAARLAAGAA